MKTIRLFGLTAAVLCAIAAFQARAQFFTIYFDENGNGSWVPASVPGWPPPAGTLNPGFGSMQADPTQAGNPLRLTYMLPVGQIGSGGQPIGPVLSGDVVVWEDYVGGTISDVLRFTNPNGVLDGNYDATEMIYYSDVGDADLADTGFPTSFYYENDIIEQGIEGFNGIDWEPGGPANNIYIGISDVPEPTSLGLMTLGGLLGLRRLFYRKLG